MPSYTGGQINYYNTFRQWMADGTLDLDNDSFYATLHSSSLTPSATSSLYTLGSYNELSTANGYTQGQVSANLLTTTFAVSAVTPSIAPFTVSAKTVSVVTSTINPKYMLIHSSANRNSHPSPLVCWIDLNPTTTTATIAVAPGEQLSVSFATNRLFNVQ